ncbi:hypothetical protein A2801_03810 [Candidatus Woesebacteria bacterium RIFCSPHIGHO2_01_FULL_41_10]|uniref:DUF559 domain-containing protein n=1 Tax=Candidatus Woesebacteria bacterium RIFCSPHIGHO2_01_FULL_41_10 TaxID=1802500 RepID=A0A1F7YMX0_9BACT|nr:MAG: hypothetical protein A2801_03810 [Candidatus Woesebacteria bacterium RIFCSPHIGHO2_01_FULL_41_10]
MKHHFIYNNSKRKNHRRYLRKQATKPELLLWSKLKRKQLGIIFRRQYSIGPYVVDFYCPSKRLVVELDGSQHIVLQEYDNYRTNYLNSLDIEVIRFKNEDIFNSVDMVVEEIAKKISPLK